MSEQEHLARQQKQAAKDAISRLPKIIIEQRHCKQVGLMSEGPTCTVCTEQIRIGTRGMFMPCGHVYHPDCLMPWLEKQNTCPVCRFELPLE